jgi:flagellar biosynthesis protein FliR
VILAITVQLALPIVIVVLMADLGVGYMSKVAQQASSLTQDLITITKPVAGMTILIVLLPNLMSITYKQTEGMIKDLDRLMRAAHATKGAGPPGLPPPARVPAGSAR